MAQPITPTRELTAAEYDRLQEEMRQAEARKEPADRVRAMQRVYDAVIRKAKAK